MPEYIEKNIKQALIKGKYTDSFFISKYRFNIYRGCQNSCAYCDGRAEGYYTPKDFGNQIEVKINIIDVLKKEIPKIKEKGIIFVGGGVGDSYQKPEEKYQLARQVLQFLKDYNFPIHILTKSALVERDFDILQQINGKNKSTISFSFCSNNQKIVDIFEPNCASVKERFYLLEKFKKNNFYTGIMYMPVIPFICDKKEDFNSFLKDAKNSGVDFVIFSGMTLKTGIQKDYFLNVIKNNYPNLLDDYDKIYPSDNKYGAANSKYYTKIYTDYYEVLKEYKIPSVIPHYIYKDKIEMKDEVAMILFHIYQLLKSRGEDKKVYEFAAWNILKLEEDIITLTKENKLQTIKGIGTVISGIIKEIVEKRRCNYYEKLL